MPHAQNPISKSPEALVVGLARTGDRDAFAELVRRRQSWIRNLMLRCCGDINLADDLAQQVFLRAWRDIGRLRQAKKFGAWLKQLAINVWRQHIRKHDTLRNADQHEESQSTRRDGTSVGLDLDSTLARLAEPVRLCVILAYHEGMSHGEIAKFIDLPLGTVKSHIRRGTQHLQQYLSAYTNTLPAEESS